MDLKNIKISEKEVQSILGLIENEQSTVTRKQFTGNACEIYINNRPIIIQTIATLSIENPKATSAIATLVAIMDKACKEE
jgi:hypothetical protein